MKRAYFAVEGPHDVAVVGRLLRAYDLKYTKDFSKVDAFWVSMVPRDFPHQDDLSIRVPVPLFFASETHSVAVQSLGGVSQIPEKLVAGLNNLDALPDGVGILVDADFKHPAKQQFDTLIRKVTQELVDTDLELTLPSEPGAVAAGPPRFGIFVLPDNQAQGTLENLLLACAEEAYPSLLASAKAWIDPLETSDHLVFPKSDDRKEFAKPAGKAKAIAGCVANILKPGRSIQVSIQDNEWLKNPGALQLPLVKNLASFLAEVAQLTSKETHHE